MSARAIRRVLVTVVTAAALCGAGAAGEAVADSFQPVPTSPASVEDTTPRVLDLDLPVNWHHGSDAGLLDEPEA